MSSRIQTDVQVFKNALAYCIRLTWNTSPLYAIVRAFAYLANALLPFVSIYASKYLLDTLSEAVNRDFNKAVTLLLIISATQIIRLLLNRLNQYIQNIQSELISNKIRLTLMKKTMSMDMEYFDSPDYMDMLQAVTIDSIALQNIVWNMFTGASGLVSLLSAWIMISTQNWLYAFIVTIAAIPAAIMSQRYTNALYGWRISHTGEDRKMGYIQSLTNQRVFAGEIRLFNLKDYFINRYQNIWIHFISGRKKLMKKQLMSTMVTSLLPEICVFVILIQVVRGIFEGTNTVGDYTLYLGLLGTLTGSIMTAIDAIAAIYEDKLKVDTVSRFESRQNTVKDIGERDLSGDMEIEFIDVGFWYPNCEHYVLKNLSFRISSNEKICFIGVNGAGKSTIIKLLLRFYDVTEGQILINGHDIREYSLRSLRRCFSIFFQQYDKYAFSIRDNITISDIEKEDASDDHVKHALKQAGAVDLLNRAKSGLDTYLTRIFDNDGMETSGGESQKIALARAIYRDCSAIIFDEPSSSLDPISESELFEHMQSLFKDKTAIFTSHRMFIVHMADRIFYLENGKITEQGSHKELMEFAGQYAKLYILQADKYRREYE
ncbi:MAG: ABC transporter ATP-binding protein/permease [Oscillospiraceae bacterium]|jgi:ABC-type multidrug transport system fused ATPase/permease subunit|nr:ABC transporter ATP-binding protein/permease [Oscillospiraceae bacterium]